MDFAKKDAMPRDIAARDALVSEIIARDGGACRKVRDLDADTWYETGCQLQLSEGLLQ